MQSDDDAGEWDDLDPQELQALLAGLGVQMTLAEVESLRQLLAATDDAESALEVLAEISKAA